VAEVGALHDRPCLRAAQLAEGLVFQAVHLRAGGSVDAAAAFDRVDDHESAIEPRGAPIRPVFSRPVSVASTEHCAFSASSLLAICWRMTEPRG
jgi:hypothetical protein